MRSALAIASLGLISLLASGSAVASEPAGLDAIAAYAGSWQTSITHLDALAGKPATESHTLRNDCWRSDDYYACHQYVDGKSAALIVYTYDAANRSYATWPIAPGEDAAHAGKLTIDGNVWTFPWQATHDGKTTWFRVVNVFASADRIEFRQEYSTDQKHWIATATGFDRRITAVPASAPSR